VHRPSQRAARWLTAAALLLLTCYGAWLRWRTLAASPYPLGVDGYFYPIQLRELLERGQLYYPSAPLAFWLMAPLAALTDPIVGVKLGATAAGALVTWPAYAAAARLVPAHRRVAGLAAATVAVSSAGSLMLATEFVKNCFGVTVGLAAVAALWAVAEQPSRRRAALALGALLAALLTHKMAWALALLLGAPPLGYVAWRDPAWRSRRRVIVVAGGALALAWAVGGAAAPRFVALGDLALLRGLGSGRWLWSAPALATSDLVVPLHGEAWLAGAAALLAAALLLYQRRARGADGADAASTGRTLAVPLVLLCAGLVAWPALAVADPQGLGFRLRVVAFVPLALAAALSLGTAVALAARAGRRGRRAGHAAVAVALTSWLASAPTALDRGVVHAHPAMIRAIRGVPTVVPRGDTVVVAERHLAFMATWYGRVITSLRQDAGAPGRRWRLMPLAFIGLDSPLAHAIDSARQRADLAVPIGLHLNHRNGLVVMPEATWQWILAQLPPGARRIYAAWTSL
jgi:hypothetical protein